MDEAVVFECVAAEGGPAGGRSLVIPQGAMSVEVETGFELRVRDRDERGRIPPRLMVYRYERTDRRWFEMPVFVCRGRVKADGTLPQGGGR